MTLVFRYSDFQVDTFLEHKTILDRTGAVWWGWWKKKHEEFPERSLRNLQQMLSKGQVQIGLVNRAGVFLIACCDRAAMRSDAPITSPDGLQTPNYYRTDSFPLWLRLVHLKKVSAEDWVSRFGPVPVGDDTIFDANPGELEVVDEAQSDSRGRGLLHISDLHFGADFAFVNTGVQFPAPVPLERRIASSVRCQPAGVIVSGDLTTQGNNDGLVEARLFLQRLAVELELPHERIVIAPGNHDILLDDPLVTRDFSNEEHFRTQLHQFYGEKSDLERVHQFSGADGVEYIVATLNSCRPRDLETMDYGYVGRDRSEPLLKRAAKMRDAVSGETFLVLVLHHHILPGQQIATYEKGRPVSLAIDAGELVGMAADLRFDAIMHGHEHVPFVGKTSRIAEFGGYNRRQIGEDHSVLVLSAGSVSARFSRLSDEMRYNSFSFYDVNSNAVRVQVFQFSARVEPQVPAQWDFPVSRNRN